VPRPPPSPLDRATLEHVLAVLAERLQAVEIYGAGGCPTCRDSELRGALHTLREMLPSGRGTSQPPER
jgi:hypothetical protein